MRQRDLEQIVIPQHGIDELVNMRYDVVSVQFPLSDPAVITEQRLEEMVNVQCGASESQIERAQNTNVFAVFLLHELDHDLLRRSEVIESDTKNRSITSAISRAATIPMIQSTECNVEVIMHLNLIPILIRDHCRSMILVLSGPTTNRLVEWFCVSFLQQNGGGLVLRHFLSLQHDPSELYPVFDGFY